MPAIYLDDFSLVVVVLGFLSGALLLESLLLLWQSWRAPAPKKLTARLQNLVSTVDLDKTAHLEKRSLLAGLPGAEQLQRIFPLLLRIEPWVRQSGIGWSAGRFLSLSLLCSVLVLAALFIFTQAPLPLMLALSLIAAGLPTFYLWRKRAQRLEKLARQLPQVLDFLVRSMRTGSALANGLHMIVEKMPEPSAGEFRIVRDEISFGVSLQQALTNLTLRVPNADLRYFVIAMVIHREMGGALTEILDNLSRLIRERQRFFDKVKVLVAEVQLSGWVLALLPFVLGILLSLLSPKYMAPLWTDPIGGTLIKYGLLLMIIGILALRKMARIRV